MATREANKPLPMGVGSISTGWLAFMAIALLGVIFGIVGYVVEQQQGMVATGMRDLGMMQGATWGIYISLVVYFVGVSFAGITVAALIRLFNLDYLKGVARMAEVMTVVALVLGAAAIVVDLGQPLRGIVNLFRYARPQSPFFGTFTLVISGYLFASLVYLYVTSRPDAAVLAERSSKLRRFFRFWAAGYADTPEQRSDPDLFVRDPDFRGHIFLDADVFAGWLHRPWREPFSEQRYCDGLLRNRMLNELFHEAVPPMLHADDHNAMAASIENRSPYLDRRLFDLAQRIPTRHLVRHGRAKAVLRDALRGIAPDPVLDARRKVGFNAPITAFLDVGDPAVRRQVLADGPIFEHVRREAIEALLDADGLPNSRSKFLFNFLNARIFLEEFGP